MAKKTSVRAARDRWADWALVGVLVVALLLGWGVMAIAEGQRGTYTNANAGLTVHYPQDWLVKNDENLAFRAVNPDSGEFGTTYEVRVQPIDTTGAATSTLALVLNNASLLRAQQGTAYRLFDVVEGPRKDGQPTMEATYVYVAEGGDFFVQRMPVVVEGLDVAVAQGDKAYVFSLLAAKDAFAAAERDFRRFVESVEIKK